MVRMYPHQFNHIFMKKNYISGLLCLYVLP